MLQFDLTVKNSIWHYAIEIWFDLDKYVIRFGYPRFVHQVVHPSIAGAIISARLSSLSAATVESLLLCKEMLK